jgi:hypothetical protein
LAAIRTDVDDNVKQSQLHDTLSHFLGHIPPLAQRSNLLRGFGRDTIELRGLIWDEALQAFVADLFLEKLLVHGRISGVGLDRTIGSSSAHGTSGCRLAIWLLLTVRLLLLLIKVS